jgi:heparosan-N-sulfate-glucuronate 5-epimerase
VRKEWRLLARDILFFIRGDADVAAADRTAHPWSYPADWSYQLDREAEYFAPKDSRGIPLRDFGPPLGARYLPSRIAAYGLGHWNRWLREKRTDNAEEFRRAADWFLNAHRDGRYEHDFAVAGLPSGWISCIAQGEAVSVLTRAFRQTQDVAYVDAARNAVAWLVRSEASGGLRSSLPDGSPFLEEYPGSQYRHVLNGCLYAAVGISDLLQIDDCADAELAEFFVALTSGIARNLHNWDVGGWSAYDYALQPGVARNLNTMTYQLLQVALLDYLADVSGDERLRDTSTRWRESAHQLRGRVRALGGKLTYRLRARW